MRCVVVAVLLLAPACLHDHLVPCGDQVCPSGSLCDEVNHRCADSSGLSLPDTIALDVECGGRSSTMVPIRNIGTHSVDATIGAAVPNVTVTPSSLTLAPGEDAMLELDAVAPSASLPGIATTGTLFIAAGGAALTRSIALTTHGAVISTNVQTLDFGELSTAASAMTRSFDISNTGDEDASLEIGAPPVPYSLAGPNTLQLPVGMPHTVGVAFEPLDGSFPAPLGLSYTGSMCQPPPPSIALSGVGTGAPILVDHLVLDYGTGTCGDGATSQPLVFTNYTASPQPLTFAIAGMYSFLFSAGTAPVIPAATAGGPGTQTVMVSRFGLSPPLASGPIADTLSVTAPALTSPVTIALDQKISAPALSISTTLFPLGTFPFINGTMAGFTISNVGNAVANVTITPASMTFAGTVVGISPSSFQIPPGSQVAASVYLGTGTTPLSSTTQMFQVSTPGSCMGTSQITVQFTVAEP